MFLRLITTLALLATIAWAQPSGPLMMFVPHPVSSGPLGNSTDQGLTVWTHTVFVPGTAAVQVLLDEITLGSDEDWVEFEGVLDGEVQRLDRYRLKQWKNHSAWFNGEVVNVRVYLSPGSSGDVSINQVAVSAPGHLLTTPEGLCGSDNRVLSTDQRVCRLVRTSTQTGGGCTGWLINSRSTILGAGHCANPSPDFFVIAEFNVPQSSTSGAIRHPPVADQYPVDTSTLRFDDGGASNDWAVARLHPNSTGATAYSRQGAFTLATSLPTVLPPFITPDFRLTGFGGDSSPLTRNYTNQTRVGPATGVSSTTINYTVDAIGGDSGGVIIDESSGRAIGIHTHSGSCNNTGTAVTHPALQAAIQAEAGCTWTALSSGSARTLTCTPAVATFTPSSNRWVGIAVSSTSDWDLSIDGTSSAFTGNTCDFLLADGNQGTVPPRSTEVRRFSGSANGTVQYENAVSISISSPYTFNWSSSKVIELFEFNVTSSGSYDITITGDSDLDWRLYAPRSNTSWIRRSSATVASGTVGGTTWNGASLSPGQYCLVITRDGGPGAASPSDVTVNICPATNSILLSNIGAPSTVTAECQDLRITPTTGRWNLMGITGPSTSFELNVGSGHSAVGANSFEFVLANGRNGTITPVWGTARRTSGTGDGTAQHLVATTATVGRGNLASISAGRAARLWEFNIPTAGSYDIIVSGPSGFFWRAFSPGTTAEWRDRNGTTFSGTVGSSSVTTRTLSAGYHAIVVYKNSGPLSASESFVLHVCPSDTPVALASAGSGTTIDSATRCRTYTIAPPTGRWNAVGVTSTTDWDIASGAADSRSFGSSCDFLVSNGREGTTSPTSGIVDRFSSTAAEARLQQSFNVTLNVGSTYNANWPSSYVVRTFEFEVTSAGSYDLTVGGANFLDWRLFEAGEGAGWKRRVDSSLVRAVGSGTVTRTLGVGWHCIVVYKDGGTGTSGSFTVRAEPTPNPVPSKATLSPSSAIAGGATFTLTVDGSGFVSGSRVRWNGVNLSTTFVSSTRLRASVAASRIATAGTANVTVSSPAPGGGISNALTFTIENPVPQITSISPGARGAGTGSFTLTVNGSNYNNQSVIRFGSSNLTTTFVNGNRLTASVPASLITTPGTVNVTVRNPAPGGGTSSARPFVVENPPPVLTSITPPANVVGASSFVLRATGSAFQPGSVIRFNGTSLATTFVSSSEVRATVPASAIVAAGNVPVDVVTPAPGGGTSSTRTFEIRAPRLDSMSPNLIPIMSPASPPVNILVTGLRFLPTSTVYANSHPLPTIFISANQLLATVDATLPQTQFRGGFTINVENTTDGVSNTRVLQVGGASNQGTLRRHPLNPGPGDGYAGVFEGGAPFGLVTSILELQPPSALYPFPDPAGNFVLNVRPFAVGAPDWFVFFDGIGVYGPPQGIAFDANGELTIGGLSRPNPAAGVNLTVQGIYLDPGAPQGYNVTWSRYPDEL